MCPKGGKRNVKFSDVEDDGAKSRYSPSREGEFCSGPNGMPSFQTLLTIIIKAINHMNRHNLQTWWNPSISSREEHKNKDIIVGPWNGDFPISFHSHSLFSVFWDVYNLPWVQEKLIPGLWLTLGQAFKLSWSRSMESDTLKQDQEHAVHLCTANCGMVLVHLIWLSGAPTFSPGELAFA